MFSNGAANMSRDRGVGRGRSGGPSLALSLLELATSDMADWEKVTSGVVMEKRIKRCISGPDCGSLRVVSCCGDALSDGLVMSIRQFELF
jgi:hypothetical protein